MRSGSRTRDVNESYPRDAVQYYVDPWWEKSDSSEPVRGHLLWAFLPHVDQAAYVLVSEGREVPTEHDTATVSIEPLRVREPPRGSRLPVAGLPHYEGEVRLALRAKRRPAVVLSQGGSEVARELRTGSARYQTNSTLLVAPYYGTVGGKVRGGWKPEFVSRIRRAEYPQYSWDNLPISGATESILRLDHLQPIGNHGDNYSLTDFRLSDDALVVLDEWLMWLVSGTLLEDGILQELRKGLAGSQ